MCVYIYIYSCAGVPRGARGCEYAQCLEESLSEHRPMSHLRTQAAACPERGYSPARVGALADSQRALSKEKRLPLVSKETEYDCKKDLLLRRTCSA